MKTEYAWVIEDGKSETSAPRYFAGLDSELLARWSSDHSHAVRFCRKEDAEAVMSSEGGEVRICEHGWDTI